MPKIRFTDGAIKAKERLRPGKTIWQDQLKPGLALVVTPQNKRTYAHQYIFGGKRKFLSLGGIEVLSLKSARELIDIQRGDIHRGIDPGKKSSEKELTDRGTVRGIYQSYISAAKNGRHKLGAKKPLKHNSMANLVRAYDNHIHGAFADKQLGELGRVEIGDFINDTEDEFSISAAKDCHVLLSGMFAYAEWKEIVDVNPMRFVHKPNYKPRDKVLTDEELGKFWHKIVAKRYSATHLALLLCLATGQRRSEIAGATLSEFGVEDELEVWTIPESRTKNGRSHTLPMSGLAIDLIEEAKLLRQGFTGDFLFPSKNGANSHINPHSMTKAFRRIADDLEIEDVRLHDLRRTASSTMTQKRVGSNTGIVARILNHVSEGFGPLRTTAIYDRTIPFADMKSAMDGWAHVLLDIAEKTGDATKNNLNDKILA